MFIHIVMFPFQDGEENDRLVTDSDQVTCDNQKRMNEDPFETLLMNIGYSSHGHDDDENGDTIPCRPSW